MRIPMQTLCGACVKQNYAHQQWNTSSHQLKYFPLFPPLFSFPLFPNHWGCELTVDGRTGRNLDCSLSFIYRKDCSKLLKCKWKKGKICTPGRQCHLKVLKTSFLHQLLTVNDGILHEHMPRLKQIWIFHERFLVLCFMPVLFSLV